MKAAAGNVNKPKVAEPFFKSLIGYCEKSAGKY